MATKTKWEDTIDASTSLSTLLMLLIGGCTSYTIIISTNTILQMFIMTITRHMLDIDEITSYCIPTFICDLCITVKRSLAFIENEIMFKHELDGRDWDYNNVDIDQIMLDNASSINNTTTNPCLIMPCCWISKHK